MVAACLPGSDYGSGCHVDQDGDTDIFDIQLTAGHWGQVGIWSSGSWDLTGNPGTTPGTHFLGTTDMEALELRVAGQRALRLEPIPSPPDGTLAGGASAPNVIGGHEDNVVTTYVQGAAIGGGGSSAGFGHEVFDNFGVIGGSNNTASGAYVTTGGVWTNASSRALKIDFATVPMRQPSPVANLLAELPWKTPLQTPTLIRRSFKAAHQSHVHLWRTCRSPSSRGQVLRRRNTAVEAEGCSLA
jgi:hypothetical protein